MGVRDVLPVELAGTSAAGAAGAAGAAQAHPGALPLVLEPGTRVVRGPTWEW